MSERIYGSVKWFDAKKGYGFIVPDNGASDVFVHITSLSKSGMDTLADGQRVSFLTERSRGKIHAVDLQKE